MFGIDDAVGAGLTLINKVVDRVWPDATQVERDKMAQAAAMMEAELKRELSQSSVNAEEAKSSSVFVSGWRPAVGWVCATAFAVQYIVSPIGQWAGNLAGHPVAFPVLNSDSLMTLLFGLLGLGAYRTVEKVRGVSAR